MLDIETDSTIMIDENAEKQRRAEFIGVLGALLPQLAQMIAAEPQDRGVLRRDAEVLRPRRSAPAARSTVPSTTWSSR